MNPDSELDIWRRDWQSADAVPSDLRRRVERQVRALRLGLIGDCAVTVLIGGGVTAWAVLSPQADIVVLAVVTWFFIAAAWTLGWMSYRGKWSPAALDTAAYLDFLIAACRGRLRTIRFGAVLFVVEVTFCLAWIYHHEPARWGPGWKWLFFGSLPIDLVWLFIATSLAWGIWYRRRKRAELAYLLKLRRES